MRGNGVVVWNQAALQHFVPAAVVRSGDCGHSISLTNLGVPARELSTRSNLGVQIYQEAARVDPRLAGGGVRESAYWSRVQKLSHACLPGSVTTLCLRNPVRAFSAWIFTFRTSGSTTTRSTS